MYTFQYITLLMLHVRAVVRLEMHYHSLIISLSCISDNIDDFYTIDSGFNFSDHLRLAMHFIPPLRFICKSNVKEAVNDKKSKRLRWDKADFVSYCYATDRYLQTVNV